MALPGKLPMDPRSPGDRAVAIAVAVALVVALAFGAAPSPDAPPPFAHRTAR